MSLTYADLPSRAIMLKLTMVSFNTAQKNLSLFKLAKDLQVYQEAFDNEKNKLLEKHGTPIPNEPGRFIINKNVDEYSAKKAELLATEIKETLPMVDLTEQDFLNANCQYPQDKTFWLNAVEIGELLEFMQKLKKAAEEKNDG